MFSCCQTSKSKSFYVGVVANCSSFSVSNCFIWCPYCDDIIILVPSFFITFLSYSKSTAVPYKSTLSMVSIGTCEGDAPAALMNLVISPNFNALLTKFLMEFSDEISHSRVSVSKPASVNIFEIACTFSMFYHRWWFFYRTIFFLLLPFKVSLLRSIILLLLYSHLIIPFSYIPFIVYFFHFWLWM